MKRKVFRNVLIIAATVALIVAVVHFTAPEEPSYQGKRVSEWIRGMPAQTYNSGGLKLFVQLKTGPFAAFAGRSYVIVSEDTKKIYPLPMAANIDPVSKAMTHFGTNALPFLVKALEQQDRWYDPAHKWIWEALPRKQRGQWLSELVPALELRRKAASLLIQFPGDSRPALPAMARALDDPDTVVREMATGFVMMQGTNGSVAIPGLARNLSHTNDSLRTDSLVTLDRMRLNAEQVATVMATWPEAEKTTRWFVPRTLAYHLTNEVAAAVLSRALRVQDVKVQREALEGLLKAGTKAACAVPQLIELLDSADRRVKIAAMRVLEEIGPDAGAAVAKLEVLKRDRNADVSTAAELALAYVKRTSK